MSKFSTIYLSVIIILIVVITINCMICAFIVNVEFMSDSGVGCFCFLKPINENRVIPFPNPNNNIPLNEVIPVHTQIVLCYDDDEEKRDPELPV